ncbi:tryptophanyl-tRNA synthetase [Radiomyces spectabilis]|uniref:tryptophanyl-tRNA synthetase n=1 Tax=Radiomyces spectabilis TaxID=64574 RepID=UPI002220D699|nr:tryptophanyl-tRNA synthetase [Radiomyces spectabilis]KAI8391486.1 tryptophanyl-tRNA synthetase [Radiomyces spectabilis]
MMFKRALTTTTAKSKTILSGIQPTGIPHLGNYLGAVNNWVRLQDVDPVTQVKPVNYYMIVDLHAITMPQRPDELRASKFDMATALLACGIDPEQSALFEQSRVRAHSELAWILNCITPVGWLGRMTQWKSKMDVSREKSISHAQILADESLTSGLRMGLFDYPVLMAADILLYKATHVPVGEDQTQHLELARDIAKLFNTTFKTRLFPKPTGIIPPSTKRVMSLRDPQVKMSKSDPSDSSRINLTDTPSVIQSKIRRATTDGVRGISYDPKERPGVANLVDILAAVRDISADQVIQSVADVQSTKVFKDMVAEALIEKLVPIQKDIERLRNDRGYVEQVLQAGAQKANAVANENIEQVYKAVGLR